MKLYRIAQEDNTNVGLKEKMMQYLGNLFHALDEEWVDNAKIALYWFANNHHTGQSSELYQILSTSPYNPGPVMTLNKEEEPVKLMYDALVKEFAKEDEDDKDDKSLESLKTEALEYCTNRGHTMQAWEDEVGKSRTTSTSICSMCGKGVFVDTNPPPNGVDVSGEAVALNCDEGIQQATPEEIYRDFGIRR